MQEVTAFVSAPLKNDKILVRLAKKPYILVIAALLLLASLGVVVSTFIKGNPETSERYGTTQIPLTEILGEQASSSADQSVTINGKLQVNDTLVLSPSSQPDAAVAGQMYYDQTSNVLAYYNGSTFVTLQGEAGGGGVTTIQGQSGAVTLTAGAGIAVAGTTITNTGVISLASGNSNLIITDDAGNLTLTVDVAATLQGAYDGGNTISAASGRDIAFTLTDQATDPNLLIDLECVISCTTNGRFAVQHNGSDVLSVAPPGGTDLLEVTQTSYAAGTVTNLAASATVTGTNTTFTSTFQPGDTFTITSTTNTCTILQIISDTSLVCTANLANASAGSAYSFTPQNRWSVASNGTASIPGTVILSNPSSTAAHFSFRSDEATNDLNIGANVIGNPSDDGGSDTNTDYIQASVFNSGTGGTIDSIRVCFTTMDPTDNGFKVAVYSDNAGSPGALLSAASPPIATGAVGWSTGSLGTTVTLAPNTNYWLAHTTQVGVTTRYCRQDGGTTKYQGSFPWGTNFPANYNTTDITSTTIAAYAPYLTITDHSAITSAIKITENNEVAIRPLYNSDTAFQVFRKDGTVTMSVNNVDRYLFANQVMVGGADVNYRMFLIGNDTNGVIGARRTSNTATDSIMELFSDVGGAATLQLKVQADGTLRLGNPTADATGALLVLDTKNTAGDPTIVNGAMYYNSATGTMRCGQSGVWVSCVGGLLSSNTAVSSAVANTAAETNFDLTYSLPANYCVQGRVIRWTAQGVYSTTGAPTLTLRMKAGATALATSPTFTAGTGVTDQTWRIEGQTICNAAPGAAAATETQGLAELFTTTTAATPGELKNTATTNLATNGALTLQISAQWGTADPANTITMRQFIIEGIGP